MAELTDPISTDITTVAASSGTTMKLTLDHLLDLALTNVTLTVLTATSGAAYAPPAGSKALLLFAVGLSLIHI